VWARGSLCQQILDLLLLKLERSVTGLQLRVALLLSFDLLTEILHAGANSALLPSPQSPEDLCLHLESLTLLRQGGNFLLGLFGLHHVTAQDPLQLDLELHGSFGFSLHLFLTHLECVLHSL